MRIKSLSIIKFPRRQKRKKNENHRIYTTTKTEELKRILVSYLRKQCSYYSKIAKLESRYSYFKAWHSSLKFEKYLCYFNKIAFSFIFPISSPAVGQ